jgi:hypothetical protein
LRGCVGVYFQASVDGQHDVYDFRAEVVCIVSVAVP